MSLTKSQIQLKYPEVFESYSLQASLPEAKYVEKLKFWEGSSINCFERWTIPYFLEREKEKKRPCLRLNYPPDGKCNDCVKGTCRYDKICFMCGLEGHGAFQSYPGGKMKGELKCTKHRNFLSQLGMIRLQHGIDEEGLKVLFKLPGYLLTEKTAATAAGKKAAAAKATDAAAGAKGAATAPAATETASAATTAAAGAPAATEAVKGAASTAAAPTTAPAVATPAATGTTAAAAAVNTAAGVKGAAGDKAAIATAIVAEVGKNTKGGKGNHNNHNNATNKAAAQAAKPAAAAAPAPAPAAARTAPAVIAPTPAPAPPAPPAMAKAAAVAPVAPAKPSGVNEGTLNGSWQLNFDSPGGAQGLTGFGSSILGSGVGLNYDSLLGGSLEDSGRRPWAASPGLAPSATADAHLLGAMPALLPAPASQQAQQQQQQQQGSRLNGLSLSSGLPPMPPLSSGGMMQHGLGAMQGGAGMLPPSSTAGGPFSSLGAGLGFMSSFDALNLGGSGVSGAGGAGAGNMNPLSGMPTSPAPTSTAAASAGGSMPQAGFGNTLAALQMQMPMAAALAGAAPMQAMQLQQYQQVFEVVDGDEYASPGTLRVTLAALVADHAGAFATKGAYMTHRGISEVSVRCWRRTSAGVGATAAAQQVDMVALRAEIRALRTLSRRSMHASRILHHGVLELTHHSGDFLSLLSDTSELGTLDRFTAMQMQIATAATTAAAAAAAAGGASAAAAHGPPMAFPVSDLQCMCVQLIEGLIQCHELNIRHRDIRPANILVSRCPDELYSRQFNRGLVLKYTNFVPTALLPLCHHAAPPGTGSDLEQERWLAPEVDLDARRNGTRFKACSDVWSLGLTIYYLVSGGLLPFDSHKQACDAATSPDYRRQCLEKHGLHERQPMLYDLVERLVRPAYMRTDLQIIRCHPFLWTMECRRAMLIQFATSTTVRNSDTINALVTGIDKISPLYVFGNDGWVAPMAPFLAALIPAKIRQDLGWSGTYLLQAIKSQLTYPELLTQSVYPRMTAHQATHAYLRQITDVDFPRLLILLYELGGIHGKWVWDGDEISHSWN